MLAPVADDLVPTIDLAAPDAALAVGDACARVGFLVVVNHGVPAAIRDGAWESARAFFDLPLAQKMAVAMPYPGYPYGYAPFESERLAASLDHETPPDLKESYSAGPPPAFDRVGVDEAEAFVRQPTPWPDRPVGFRFACEAYYAAMADLSSRIMALFAESLRLPCDWFVPFIDRHTSALRALNYPSLDGAPRAGQWRAGAHTDYGTLTILMTEPAPGGLEVLGPGGTWTAVPHVPDSFVVNLGDAMARWTNDRWRSTLHRVAPPPPGAHATRRQSIAFFHNANWDATIACIPSCLEAGETPRYEPIAAGAHLMEKFRKTQAPRESKSR